MQRRLEIDGLAERAAHAVEARVGRSARRAPARRRPPPRRIGAVEHAQDAAAAPVRAARRARGPARRRRGGGRPRRRPRRRPPMQQCRGHGDLRDPRRRGDGLAPHAARPAVAVPLLVDVRDESRTPCPRPSRSGRGPRGDLAVRPAVAQDDRPRPRTAAVPARAGAWSPSRRARDAAGTLRTTSREIAEIGPHRRALDRDLVAAEQRSRLVRVSRCSRCAAAAWCRRRPPAPAPRPPRRAHRHQRAPRRPRPARVPSRGPRQRQPGQQLGEAQPLMPSTLSPGAPGRADWVSAAIARCPGVAGTGPGGGERAARRLPLRAGDHAHDHRSDHRPQRRPRDPAVGFGVFQIEPEDTAEAVRVALDAGYRHIDTAEMYGNERDVGGEAHASPPRRGRRSRRAPCSTTRRSPPSPSGSAGRLRRWCSAAPPAPQHRLPQVDHAVADRGELRALRLRARARRRRGDRGAGPGRGGSQRAAPRPVRRRAGLTVGRAAAHPTRRVGR